MRFQKSHQREESSQPEPEVFHYELNKQILVN